VNPRTVARDRWAYLVGLVAVVIVVAVYSRYTVALEQPLAIFVVPGLLAAVLGGWRPAVTIGAVCVAMTVVFGVAAALTPSALAARWLIVGIGLMAGVVGALARDSQLARIADLGDTLADLRVFELELVPQPVPRPGFVATSRYRPAEARMGIGGDFLDTVGLPDGGLAVLIGDVCGHGPREAAFGTILRAGWRGAVSAGPRDPVLWVTALENAFFGDDPMDAYATVCTAYLPATPGPARFVCAGHPPPLHLVAGVPPLALTPSPPVGLGFRGERIETVVAWDGAPILFYTDGLVENPRPGGPPDRWGEDGLRAWLAGIGGGDEPDVDAPDELLRSLMAAATADRVLRDDVAVLLIAGEPPGRVGDPQDQERELV